MGQRRANRGPAPRSDLQILASDDMELLRAIEDGEVGRLRPGASLIFIINEEPVMLRHLAREDLCTSPIGGMPVLQPRGRRLIQVLRGELPQPMPD